MSNVFLSFQRTGIIASKINVSLKVTKTCYSFNFLLNMSGHENGNLKIICMCGQEKIGKK
jgi:hypothetical protein